MTEGWRFALESSRKIPWTFINMVRQFVLFRTRHQPYMVRHTYLHELRSAMTFPLAASLAEGSFTGIVAAKYFNASPLLIAVITAAPMFGNIMAMVWAELARKRRKVPFVNMLQLGVVLTIASVSLTYSFPLEVGAWLFAIQIIIARMLASGIVTLRSGIWRANYPRHLRGQITARITTVATIGLTATTFLGSYWLDHRPEAYIYLYPIAAILGGIGIYQFSRIRVRKEGQTLRRERRQIVYAARPENIAQTDESNVIDYQPPVERLRFRRFFSDAFTILRQDKPFRDYQRWQFLSGTAFMMVNPPLVFMVSKEMTNERTDYMLATVVLQIIPMITSILFIQVWAPWFDRMHVTSFRAVQMLVAVAAQGMMFAGAVLNQLWMVAASQFLFGVTNAAGNLAWNLGHNDFAPPEKAAAYMGVHVMLTGLRGCLAPFLGVALYRLSFIDRGVFGIGAVLAVISMLGFMSMARHAPKKMPQARVRKMAQATGTPLPRPHKPGDQDAVK